MSLFISAHRLFMLTYLSVCSGIESVTVAWHPLGFEPWAFAENDDFPSAVLKHHYPEVPNLGDITRFKEWPDVSVPGGLAVLVGGTPCQSFSVAGLRAGLADPRGNLALTYLAIADRYRPRWVVWENVPGVLSSNGGRDFGAFLGGLAKLGYGIAYRILDAQYFGLAQRRQRVFVVGHLGDWRRAAAVLFERESLSWHPPPRREAGEDVTGSLAARTSAGGGLGTDFDCAGGVIGTLATSGAGTQRPAGQGNELDFLIPSHDVAQPLLAKANSSHRADAESYVAHALRADGFDASEDGTGRGTPIVTTLAIRGRGDSSDLEYRQDGTANAILTPNGGRGGIGVGAIAFSVKDHGADAGELAPTLRAGGHDKSHANGGVMPAIAFNSQEDRNFRTSEDTTNPLRVNQTENVLSAMQVRRLTPRECERLQGFPDDWTLIPYRGKPAADGPRYKALGNSMAVPVMSWIGRRILLVESL